MNRTTLLALGLLVLVALTLPLVARRPAAPRAAHGPSAESERAPAAETSTAAAASAERTQADPRAEPAPNPTRPSPQHEPTANTKPARAADAPAQLPSQPEAPQEPPRASGPIDAMKARLKSDPRDVRAHQYEELIRLSFRDKDVPDGLFESALCKKSVCRVSLRWSPDRHMGTMAGLMRLVPSFAEQVAFDPAAKPNRAGETDVDVYFARKPEE